MPYIIVAVPGGFKVQSESSGRFFSRNPMTKKQARQQQKALYAKEKKGHLLEGSGYIEVKHYRKTHKIMDGSGFFSDLFEKSKKVFNEVKDKIASSAKEVKSRVQAVQRGPRKGYPPKVRAYLAKISGGVVNSIQIRRNPIQSLINIALNKITQGKLEEVKRVFGYDKLFHLSMIVGFMLENKQQFCVIEKNEVINISPSFQTTDDTEYYSIPISPTNLTVGEMMARAEEAVGPSFFLYDAFNNNCQMFLLNILRANGLLNPEAEAFINQRADEIVKGLPSYTAPVARALTDVAAIANVAIQGEGKSEIAKSKEYANLRNIANIAEGVDVTDLRESRLLVKEINTLLDQYPLTPATETLARMVNDFVRDIPNRAEIMEKIGKTALSMAEDMEAKLEGKGAPIVMPSKDYFSEHKRLIGLLNETSGKLKAEADEQQGEVDARKKKGGMRKLDLGTDDDVPIKGIIRADDGSRDVVVDYKKLIQEQVERAIREAREAAERAAMPPPAPRVRAPKRKAGEATASEEKGAEQTAKKGRGRPRKGAGVGQSKPKVVPLSDLYTQLQNKSAELNFKKNLSAKKREQLTKEVSELQNEIRKLEPKPTMQNPLEDRIMQHMRQRVDESAQMEMDRMNDRLAALARQSVPDKELFGKGVSEAYKKFAAKRNKDLAETQQLQRTNPKAAAEKLAKQAEARTARLAEIAYQKSPEARKAAAEARYQKYLDEHPTQRFFDTAVKGLTKAGDFLVENVAPVVGVPRIVTDVYKTFAPPGSKYYKGQGKKLRGGNMQNYEMIRNIIDQYFLEVLPQFSFEEIAGATLGNLYEAYIETPQGANMSPEEFIAGLHGLIQYAMEQGDMPYAVYQQGLSFAMEDGIGDNDPFLSRLADYVIADIPTVTLPSPASEPESEMEGEGKKEVFGVKPSAYIKRVKAYAKKRGYDNVELADNGIHKIVVTDPEGKKHYAGRVGYGDFHLYNLSGQKALAKQKQRVFKASHSKIKGDWKKDKYSPNNLALRILW